MSSPDTIDATQRRWILPYRTIADALKSKGRVRVLLAGEGEATDLVTWAQVRGYRVARLLRTAVGVEILLEAAKAEEAPVATRGPRPAAEEAPAKPVPAQAPASREAGGGTAIDVISARMADPLFRVDLLLAGTSTKAGELKAPTSVEALTRLAVESSSAECAFLEATHTGGSRIELLACRDGGLVGILYYTPNGERLEGSKAMEAASKALAEAGRLEYRVTSVDRSFVEKLRG